MLAMKQDHCHSSAEKMVNVNVNLELVVNSVTSVNQDTLE